MHVYALALFAHLCGVVGIFGGLGTWVLGVAALRQTERVEQVRTLTALITAASALMVGSIVVLGIAGFYMALTVWGIRATWIAVATLSFILLAPLGLLILDPRVRAIAKQAHSAPEGPLPHALAARVRDPVLGGGLSAYVGCLFGIVFLMTNKPEIGESILVMVLALVIGPLACLPLWWSARIPTPRRTSSSGHS